LSALAIALAILVPAYLLGSQALALILRRREPALPVAEQSLFGLGLGMVLLGYVVLTIGLLGQLTPPAIFASLALSGLLGIRQLPTLGRAVRTVGAAFWRDVKSGGEPLAVWLFVMGWTFLVLLGTLAPPGDMDWDGLSQHLASPKIYLRHQTITPIWFDHHSHFPSTLQMLFTAGLAAGSAEAAKVIHLVCGIATALTLVVIGRRLLTPAAGHWAAFAFLTIPLTAWLGQVAYVDLAGAYFAALTLLGLLLFWRSSAVPDLALAGIAAAGGLAAKLQGLEVLGAALFALVVIGWRAGDGLKRIARNVCIFAGIGAALASPWYVKSAIWTGNPVYPFAYSTFGGKYWGPGQAAIYREHQAEFGVGSPPTPAEAERMGPLARLFSGPRSPQNLLLAPWNLVMQPAEFEVVTINPVLAVTATGVGPLLLVLLPLLVLARPPGPVIQSLFALLPLWLGWLMLMQYNRYLVPALAIAALPAGYVLGGAFLPTARLARVVPRAVAWCWGALALSYVALSVMPGGGWRVALGLDSRAAYLEEHSECYRFGQFVNAETPPNARIALYGEPRGFYLDRDYLWAEQGHSTLIDYAGIRSGDDLLREFGRLGITHILYRVPTREGRAFDDPQIGPALKELNRQGRLEIIGSPPRDPLYTLFALKP
jgi:hypothetical protein